ncbi:MAG TPA: hypothetical protein VGM56_03035 [Byssovorax sp.]
MDVDENGWALGVVAPLDAPAFTVLSPEPDARVDAERWAHQARRFFSLELDVVTPKRYPTGAFPLADRLEVDVARGLSRGRVVVVTLPEARVPSAKRGGVRAAIAMRRGGMDAVAERARRVWQIAPATGDARAAIAVAAVLASELLGPVVEGAGLDVFGVKGARERLAKAGWG